MKKKFLLTIIIVVLTCLLACVFVACNKDNGTSGGSTAGESSTGGDSTDGGETGETHTHTFASDWTKDESGHWHVCSGAECTEKGDFAAHVFGDWTVTTEAGYGTAGSKYRECSVCGYKQIETIAALDAKVNAITLNKSFTKTYNSVAVSISESDYTVTSGETPTIEWWIKNGEKLAAAPKKAGAYTLVLSTPASAEWQAAQKSVDFVIGVYSLSVSGLVAKDKTYDGTVLGSAEFTAVNTFAGDDVTLTVETEFEDKNAGANKEVTYNYILSGEDKDNYEVCGDVGSTATISPLQIVLENFKVNDKTYDGTKNATVSYDSDNLIDGDDVTLSVSATFNNKKVAYSCGAKIVYQLNGTDKDNYLVPTTTGLFATVSRKTFSELAVGIQYTSDPTGQTFSDVSMDDYKFGEDDLTMQIQIVSSTYKRLYKGTSEVTATLTGEDADNYYFASGNDNIYVNFYSVDVTVDVSQTFTGTNAASGTLVYMKVEFDSTTGGRGYSVDGMSTYFSSFTVYDGCGNVVSQNVDEINIPTAGTYYIQAQTKVSGAKIYIKTPTDQ